MAKVHKLYKICPQCGGTGQITDGDGKEPASIVVITCPKCEGLKIILEGYLTEEDYEIAEVPE